MPKYARIAFPIPYENYFTYKIPVDLAGSVKRGMIVTAPLGNRPAAGVVLKLSEYPGRVKSGIKEISGLGDPELSIPEDLFKLIERAAGTYGTTPGIVLKAALPSGTLQRKNIYFYPGKDRIRGESTPEIAEFLNAVKNNPGKISFKDVQRFKGVNKKGVDTLIQTGFLTLSPFMIKSERGSKKKWVKAAIDKIPDDLKLSPKANSLLEALLKSDTGFNAASLAEIGFSASSAATLHRKGLVEYEYRDREFDIGRLESLVSEDVFELTLWQRAALQRVEESIDKRSYHGILLYGVTSSGKTQVYIEAARHALKAGRSVLVLAPEISLTPQLVSRFERALGVSPMVWHSRLTPSEKANVYKRARSGDIKLLIGARSSIFCPLKNLGLIVVDEEQDGSYKQDDPAPRYNARDLALERGKITGSTVILGSATPSVETYYAALEGKIELFTLPQRVAGKGLPEIKVISTLLKEGATTGTVFPKGFWPVSEPLYTELSIRLKKKEQAIILLNRRGYSSSVVCYECGWLGKCPDCEIGWTYHKSRGKMVCHYCGKERSGLSVCPECNSSRISFKGAGTEKLEETLKSLFPLARISRLDSDVVSGRWKSRDILDDFGKGEIDILLGTQMVAKGHHFPAVGFVGVIGADVGLSLPDFRASERVLQLLTQAAGRAGRSSKKSERGLVIIQTFSPQNMIFHHLLKDDYTGFLKRELDLRKELDYPPFSRLISIIISSVDSSKAARGANFIKEEIERKYEKELTEILGPAKASIFKRGKEYRYQVLLKIPADYEHGRIADSLNALARDMRGVAVRIDIDPFSFV